MLPTLRAHQINLQTHRSTVVSVVMMIVLCRFGSCYLNQHEGCCCVFIGEEIDNISGQFISACLPQQFVTRTQRTEGRCLPEQETGLSYWHKGDTTQHTVGALSLSQPQTTISHVIMPTKLPLLGLMLLLACRSQRDTTGGVHTVI